MRDCVKAAQATHKDAKAKIRMRGDDECTKIARETFHAKRRISLYSAFQGATGGTRYANEYVNKCIAGFTGRDHARIDTCQRQLSPEGCPAQPGDTLDFSKRSRWWTPEDLLEHQHALYRHRHYEPAVQEPPYVEAGTLYIDIATMNRRSSSHTLRRGGEVAIKASEPPQ